MGTISSRLPDDLEAELETYIEEEKLDRSTAVRKLLAEGLEDWRTDRALEALADGRVTLSRAANMADCSVWELTRLARERDVVWVGDDHLAGDLDEL